MVKVGEGASSWVGGQVSLELRNHGVGGTAASYVLAHRVQGDHIQLARLVRVLALCVVPGPSTEVVEVARRVLQGVVFVVAYGWIRSRLVHLCVLYIVALRANGAHPTECNFLRA